MDKNHTSFNDRIEPKVPDGIVLATVGVGVGGFLSPVDSYDESDFDSYREQQ